MDTGKNEKEEFTQKSAFSKFFEDKKVRGIGLLILACIYMISPWDVIPEIVIGGVWPYMDDTLVFVLANIKSYGLGKSNV